MAHLSSIFQKLSSLKEVMIKTFILTAYLASWFCALVFLSNSILEIDGVPYIGFGLAIIKAAVSAKFMMMGIEFFPMKMNSGTPLLYGILKRSIVYVLIVVSLSYLFNGIEGYFHQKGFVESLHNFAGGSLKHLLALSIMYWLIVMPYLAFVGFREVIGDDKMRVYLLGLKK